MRTIVHLSDLHFGRHDSEVVNGLTEVIRSAQPHLIVISGDFTQRARVEEFAAASEFMAGLPAPVLAVPGNHDVPLYDLAARFLRPLNNYRRYIEDDLQPSFMDDEIAVIGINTARSMTFKNGRINQRQIAECCERLNTRPRSAVRIVVTHHPFDLPAADISNAVVGRSAMAMSGLAQCGVEIVLSGHLHVRHTGSSAERYQAHGHSVLLIQAGTATSTRQRGELNSCNILSMDGSRLAIEWLIWNKVTKAFALNSVDNFIRGESGFLKEAVEIRS